MAVGDLDFVTAFSAVGACLNNLGPGLGDVAVNYADISLDKVDFNFQHGVGAIGNFHFAGFADPSLWRR